MRLPILETQHELLLAHSQYRVGHRRGQRAARSVVSVHGRDSRIMPEQRLQRCRDAYETFTERERVDSVILAIYKGWRPWHVNIAERRASAAYRITQAQLAADTKK